MCFCLNLSLNSKNIFIILCLLVHFILLPLFRVNVGSKSHSEYYLLLFPSLSGVEPSFIKCETSVWGDPTLIASKSYDQPVTDRRQV